MPPNKKEYFSYSKIDTYKQCPMKYKLRYIDKKFVSVKSLALDIGSLAHKICEIMALDIAAGKQPDTGAMLHILENGYHDPNDKRNPYLMGVAELKKQYFYDWIAKDEKSGLTYDDRIAIFKQYIENFEGQFTKWKPVGCEQPFEMEIAGITFKGVIDRIDRNVLTGEYRIVDYKSSKKTYQDKDVVTPLQMVVYHLALKQMKNIEAVEHLYDFVFIDKVQQGGTKGFVKRGEKKLTELLMSAQENQRIDEFVPNPTPLCHWCEYCSTSSVEKNEHKNACPYHSLWTPTNKVFSVNKAFNAETDKQNKNFWY